MIIKFKVLWLLTIFSKLILGQKCFTTKDSVDPNKQCIFPFKFKGVTFYGCPTDLIDKKRRWCSTKTDSSGNHVRGEGKYGFCTFDCPKHFESSEFQIRHIDHVKRALELKALVGKVSSNVQNCSNIQFTVQCLFKNSRKLWHFIIFKGKHSPRRFFTDL